jgi:cyclopropane fatty-acyl-phospholipid synthase-like methyltransferase
VTNLPNGQTTAAQQAGNARQDFWRKENLNFSKPHYRLEKARRIIEKVAKGKECTLLDLGCGPATLMHMLPPSVHYYGIDIAIQQPAPNLLEADIIRTPIRFGDMRFDVVHAQGIFEYVGDVQSQKFAEIAALLTDGGVFIASYWNFGHRDPQEYFAHSNIQTIAEFRADLSRHFIIDRFFPASHNLHQHWPGRKLSRAVSLRLNVNIPVVSPMLAVEYFACCHARGSAPGNGEAGVTRS